MSLTTIPIQKETREKIKNLAQKSENWDDVINRLYENTLELHAASVLFEGEYLDIDEAIKEIEKW